MQLKNLDMDLSNTIDSVMSKNVKTIALDSPLSTANRLFVKNKIRHLPVVNKGQLVGILSHTDLLRLSFGSTFGTEESNDDTILDMLTIEHVMQNNPTIVYPKTTIREAVKILSNAVFHALPVVDDKGKVIGILTTTDILKYVLEYTLQKV